MMRSDFSINNKSVTNTISKSCDNILALIIHPDYDDISVALTSAVDIIGCASVSKYEASKNILFCIDSLLKDNNLKTSDLDFLSAQIGPGPFTTLRVALATINGLAYPLNIPLVPVDGLEAFINEKKIFLTDNNKRYLVIILNAFCNDVYFGIYDKKENKTEKGYCSIDEFINKMQNLHDFENNNLFIGNGVKLYEQELKVIQNKIFVPDSLPEICSLEAVKKEAYKNWKNNIFQKQLLPLYLKPGPLAWTRVYQ